MYVCIMLRQILFYSEVKSPKKREFERNCGNSARAKLVTAVFEDWKIEEFLGVKLFYFR